MTAHITAHYQGSPNGLEIIIAANFRRPPGPTLQLTTTLQNRLLDIFLNARNISGDLKARAYPTMDPYTPKGPGHH